jgi:cytochrome c5
MKESDPHSSPIKSPKQLIIVVVLAFVVPIVVIVLLTQLVTGGWQGAREDDKQILSRIQAVGNVVILEPSAPKGNLTGDAVYGQVCKTCHDAGLAGAPKIGDKGVWGPRIAQSQSTITQHAIAGFQGKTGVMPPKGGNADLTDTEVGRAVVYMANQAGANWKEPAAPAAPSAATGGGPAPAASPSATTPPPAQATAPASSAPAVAAAKPDGKKIYDTTCVACHGAGIAGAPKFGDKSAWTTRIAEGNDTLYAHAIQGFQGKGGVMPPKGGNTTLADADVKAAVDYTVSAGK